QKSAKTGYVINIGQMRGNGSRGLPHRPKFNEPKRLPVTSYPLLNKNWLPGGKQAYQVQKYHDWKANNQSHKSDPNIQKPYHRDTSSRPSLFTSSSVFATFC